MLMLPLADRDNHVGAVLRGRQKVASAVWGGHGEPPLHDSNPLHDCSFGMLDSFTNRTGDPFSPNETQNIASRSLL